MSSLEVAKCQFKLKTAHSEQMKRNNVFTMEYENASHLTNGWPKLYQKSPEKVKYSGVLGNVKLFIWNPPVDLSEI